MKKTIYIAKTDRPEDVHALQCMIERQAEKLVHPWGYSAYQIGSEENRIKDGLDYEIGLLKQLIHLREQFVIEEIEVAEYPDPNEPEEEE